MDKEIDGRHFKLNTGALMPSIALGLSATAKMETPEEIKTIIRYGVEAGYRHFDTASVYRSEHILGEVLEEIFNSGTLKREDVFITTKLAPSETHPDDVIPALRRSLRELRLEYIDMYLIHFPIRIKTGTKFVAITEEKFLPLDLVGVWKALEHGVELGLTKAIGISNSGSTILRMITADAKIIPAVNQMEMHPGCLQPKLLDTCKQLGTVLMAFSPLGSPGHHIEGKGSNAVIDSLILKDISQKHGKTVEQVALRWTLDHGAGLVCKSRNPVRLALYLEVFGWKLDEEDHKRIETLPRFMLHDGVMLCNSTTSPYRTPKDILDDWYE